ncbi:tetraacyldisaccharide 4'-kinase [Bizionia saleffrena]|uniref:Tetraacyldisaccharide 4'-kinase n=1 Tax=Bizionia saleffrena TaxID=291189 RepID=A0A8H2LEM1_9FLAO|nr:tetraacyldisaccharide 4'-kinase [Bizionia saleffrena]TYB73924.1 tetraacyldisaccharide 4'-kinase [Bizionia saleffrena]
MKLLRFLLFPVMPFYFVVTWLRNVLYDYGFKKSKSYDFPLLCVGNLSAGGTGKTPMVEYLIRVLKDDFKIATLSRGYGRETEVFVLGTPKDTAKTLGDEPFQFYSKFSKDIQVAVDANRQNGIAELRGVLSKPEVIILDDAFQHRKVTAGLNILLTTYSNLYYKDCVLPTGNLREPRVGAKRANIIVVTKCPKDITDGEKAKIVKEISPEVHQTVFFSTIVYSEMVFSDAESRGLKQLPKFTLVTGIANASPLVAFLNAEGLAFKHLEFKDHYSFTATDIKSFEAEELLLTTEKDFMRLKNNERLKHKLFYLPIEAQIDNSENFNNLITAFVAKY